jgi:hypothetical protein
MWALWGLGSAVLFMIGAFAITYYFGTKAAEADPSIGGAYVASLFFTLPFSAITGFIAGVLFYFLR